MSINRRNVTSEDLKDEVLAKIQTYAENGFPEALRIHELIMQANPSLYPRLWYGMPGYAKTKDGAVLCFFRKDEYITFGITEAPDIEALSRGGSTVASAWFITKLDQAAEELISQTVAKAAK